jgi:hypothetical protein
VAFFLNVLPGLPVVFAWADALVRAYPEALLSASL